MTWPWDKPLKDGQMLNPILNSVPNTSGYRFTWNEEKFLSVFSSPNKHQLKTWGNADKTSEPHWIGVIKPTPLHTDPRYPRYTWHLLVHVDTRFVIRGINKVETNLVNGYMIELDTHSPHQLHALSKEAKYYFAASIDSKERIPYQVARQKLIRFVNTNPIDAFSQRITR